MPVTRSQAAGTQKERAKVQARARAKVKTPTAAPVAQRLSPFERLPVELRLTIYEYALQLDGFDIYYFFYPPAAHYMYLKIARSQDRHSKYPDLNEIIWQLALGLLGPVCKMVRYEVLPVFWGCNFFRIGDTMIMRNLLYTTLDASYLKRLQLGLRQRLNEELLDIPHGYIDRVACLGKALKLFSALEELHLFCDFADWESIPIGHLPWVRNSRAKVVMDRDFKEQDFFSQLDKHPSLKTLKLLDERTDSLRQKNEEGELVNVDVETVERWMRSRLITEKYRIGNHQMVNTNSHESGKREAWKQQQQSESQDSLAGVEIKK
ncbi:hypothetical protein P154DRAFT_584091 [Amniculicola lignicola CBS 123094]|uniref:Uncharacterized protein n=1 Tax=Amniculicola lignicola CBS 123094 TaxID=1392246 RepID=A0A6A5X4K5_9PLEO|nr:hypothetical protein P154DRAFT_584091 [Amniculicola lignicola CBS 123094]